MHESLAPLDNRKSAIENQKSPPPLHLLRSSIIHHLAIALDRASRQLAQHAAGRNPFPEPTALASALTILKTLPQILPHLPEPPPPPAPRPAFDPYWLSTLDREHRKMVEDAFVPPCPICHAAPGHHWVMHCPQKQLHHDLTALCSLQSYWARENRADGECQKLIEATKPSSLPPEQIEAIFARLRAQKQAEALAKTNQST